MRKTVLFIWTAIIVSGSSGFAAQHQFQQVFADVAEKANPAVVTIVTDKIIKMDDFHKEFEEYFGWNFLPPGMDNGERRTNALGSGVIVDSEKGYVLTNNHVVEDTDEITIRLLDKREFTAKVIGTDSGSDLAVLQIDADDLSSIPLGNSDAIRVGEWVVAVGSPFSPNLSHTVTVGIVSALGRSNIIGNNKYEDFIQTDAAINPGNSGGALLNLDGELVGINTAIATGGFERANRGVGFAIPSNMVKNVMDDLIERGYVQRAWLGVYIQDLDDATARALDLDTRNGALVGDVVDGSPAEKAGIETGDVIIRFNDLDIRDPSHLKNVVSSSNPQSNVNVEVLRNGRNKSIAVNLEELPDQNSLASTPAEKNEDESLGLRVQDLNSSLRERFNIERGVEGVVVTSVNQNSAAARAGIRAGDVITRVGTKKVRRARDFTSLVKKAEKNDMVLLHLRSGDVARFLTLQLDN